MAEKQKQKEIIIDFSLLDIVDCYDNKPVKKVKIEIELLRSKKDRTQHCVYGPGKKSYGHKCTDCETRKMICLSVHVEIDNLDFGYVSSDSETINSLLHLCDPVLEIKEK
jgi:hypothetical protein